MSGQHDDAVLSRKAIIALCRIAADPLSGKMILGSYRLKNDGLYVVPLKSAVLHTLTPEEIAAAEPWHPTGRYDEPALPLPCTVRQLRKFVKRAGLNGCINELRIDDLVAQYAQSSDSDGDAAEAVGAGRTANRNKWTDEALKALWRESIQPGMTQKALAEKYGVTHQNISKQLRRAAERFSKIKTKVSVNKKPWLS